MNTDNSIHFTIRNAINEVSKGKKQKKNMLTTEHGYKILSVESHCKSKCSSLVKSPITKKDTTVDNWSTFGALSSADTLMLSTTLSAAFSSSFSTCSMIVSPFGVMISLAATQSPMSLLTISSTDSIVLFSLFLPLLFSKATGSSVISGFSSLVSTDILSFSFSSPVTGKSLSGSSVFSSIVGKSFFSTSDGGDTLVSSLSTSIGEIPEISFSTSIGEIPETSFSTLLTLLVSFFPGLSTLSSDVFSSVLVFLASGNSIISSVVLRFDRLGFSELFKVFFTTLSTFGVSGSVRAYKNATCRWRDSSASAVDRFGGNRVRYSCDNAATGTVTSYYYYCRAVDG
ncbi:hypothetical protein AGLY_003438 [Aphis glycines]|uniref:Uncharacterized protein n=1 Tax=Aphis glycines TaxID=307491 RepID=A0A6G0TZM5_APHGL|nr:hypothetical protein AGLY_003438 [Aphis glycines]